MDGLRGEGGARQFLAVLQMFGGLNLSLPPGGQFQEVSAKRI